MVTVVERELYAISEAARILRVKAPTLRWWLEGRDEYPPVIRVEPTGSPNVTWGEFVEAGFLRNYRHGGVPLPHIRQFVDELRGELGVPYPLAHAKPLIGPGRRLVLEAQREAGLEHPIAYEALGGQVLLEPALDLWVRRIDFAPEDEGQQPWAVRVHPAGRTSPVIIDPDYSFGAPTVQGIRTDAIVDLLEAGELPEDVAADFDLDLRVVKAAAAYEWAEAA